MYLHIAFCAFVAVGLYPYLIYPTIMWLLARWHNKHTVLFHAPLSKPVSLVLCAYNEESNIGSRVVELANAVGRLHRDSEVIVVSDGSTDHTANHVKTLYLPNVELIELPRNHGKAHSLSVGVAMARHDIVVFADVRQTWDQDALYHLIAPFGDPGIGAVSGDLELSIDGNALATAGVYWRLEKWLRRNETRWNSLISVTGAISAVRRELFRPIPIGTILDDVYWPMMVALQGKRVVHQPLAKAFDRLPHTFEGEYRRKVRTLSGNYQLVARVPSLLMPWTNRLWFQFMSHKVLRLAVPWCFLASWCISLILAADPIYALFSALQFGAFVIGIVAWLTPLGQNGVLLRAAGSVFGLNYAAWMAFWVWLSGRSGQVWQKVNYSAPDAQPEAATLA